MRTALACPEPPEDGPLLVSGAITAASLTDHRAVVSSCAVATATVASAATGRLVARSLTTHTIGGTGRHQEA